jgi:hypothetical protein
MRRFFTSLTFLLLTFSILEAQTGASSLAGNVKDDTGEPVISGTVSIYKDGSLLTGVLTDFDGNYNFGNVDPGKYDVEVSYVGFQTQRVAGVVVLAGRTNFLNFELSSGVNLDEVVVTDYRVPLIEQDNTTRGGIKTGDEIRNLPTKNINALAATTAGLSSQDEGKDINVRGSRAGATNYYLDGIRVSGSLPPETEIDQLQVITGGFPAEIGDITGGGISITTKGASKRYSGQVELETSQFLDAFGYNLINGFISGPIIKRKDGESLLGFRLSGRYRRIEEDNPAATGTYVGRQSVIDNLKLNPVQFIGSANVLVPTAEQLTNQDVTLEKARPNEREERLDITSKLDFRLSKEIDLSVTGTYNQVRDQFTPNSNAVPGGWSLLNYNRNPTNETDRYRLIARFRHRLGRGAGEGASNSVIQNASYYLQFGVEYDEFGTSDPIHGEKLWDYGHLGRFNYEYVPVFGTTTPQRDPNGFTLANGTYYGFTGYNRQFQGYDPTNSRNPGLSLYNSLVPADNTDAGAYTAINGFIPDNLGTIYGFYNNVNTVYNNFQKGTNNIYTFTGGMSFDLLPGGSAKGRHTLSIGAMYEQRDNRFYTINPNRLWVLAGLYANEHIVGFDSLSPIGVIQDTLLLPDSLTPVNLVIYDPLIADVEGEFYKRVRERFNVPLNQYVEVDMLDPSDMSLDLFSSRELTDQPNIMNYYGYDYLGNLLGGNVSFNDFFTQTDVNGQRTFPVAAWQPTYLGLWLQDKFTYKDIIFRVGLRADRYDANTKVLKDQYSLYDIITADAFYSEVLQSDRPSNIGEDYKVYVTQEGGKDVQAYRKDDQWYYPNGAPAPDGRSIYGTSTARPYYQQQDANIRDIRSNTYDPNTSFEDYKAKLIWVPRLSFSFPISQEANFFANYDVLVSRPTSNTIVTPLQYFYFEDQGRTPQNNPNLQPEKTIVYEVGFQQKLNNSSALRLSAYYRELRDLIQRRTILYVPAPVSAYDTYGNIDFGTVKAFSIEYDLRRTGNITVNANYTLQFADGTGSDANSQNGLTNRGLNIRTLFPFSYDERHTLNVILDYRYSSGKKYNGPRLFGRDIFSDAGINIQSTAVSGRPYTRNLVPSEFGGSGNAGTINGNRLPWRFNLDLRVDKRFNLTSKTAENPRPLWLNAYLRVQNVLNIQNTLGVYSASGSPDDSGFLASTFGSSAIQTLVDVGRDPQYYLDAYNWALVNPGFFNLPRRILLGAIFEF